MGCAASRACATKAEGSLTEANAELDWGMVFSCLAHFAPFWIFLAYQQCKRGYLLELGR
jgi:hypothetical protein